MGLISSCSINLSSFLHHPHQEALKSTKMPLPSLAALSRAFASSSSALGADTAVTDPQTNAKITECTIAIRIPQSDPLPSFLQDRSDKTFADGVR